MCESGVCVSVCVRVGCVCEWGVCESGVCVRVGCVCEWGVCESVCVRVGCV